MPAQDAAAVALGRLEQVLADDALRAGWTTVAEAQEALGSAARDGYLIAIEDFLAWLEDGRSLGGADMEWEGFQAARDAWRGVRSCARLPLALPEPGVLYEIADRMLLGEEGGTIPHELYDGRMDNWQAAAREILAEGRGLGGAARLVKAFHELQPVGPRVSFGLARALTPLFLQLCLDLERPGPWISADLGVEGIRGEDIGLTTGFRRRRVDGYQEIAVKGTDAAWQAFFTAAVAKAAARGLHRARRCRLVLEQLEEKARPQRAGGLLDRVRPRLTSLPVFTKKDVARWADANDHTAEKLCRDLLATVIVAEMTGRKRYRVYWIPGLWF